MNAIDHSSVLARTDQGLEEIRTRAMGLPQRLRSLLLLLNGTFTVGTLVEKLTAFPSASQDLERLLELNLVRVVRLESEPTRTAPVSLNGSTTREAPSRVHVLVSLVRFLHDAAGPNADRISIELENSRTPEQFQKAVDHGEKLLMVFANESQVANFRAMAADTFRQLFPADTGG